VGRRTAAAIVVVAASLLVVALAACGDDDEDGSAATTAEEATTTGADGRPGYSGAGGGDDAADEEGAGGGDRGSGDRQQVEAAIAAVLSDADSERVCREVLSEDALASAYGDLQGCIDGRRPVTLADGIRELRDLELDGGTATAVVVPDGGLYDRVELELTAVRDGDSWRIDSLQADIPVGP
jgi:hypothetical protein